MSADTTGTEVFEDVEPDPDAILSEFGVGSPDELADSDDGAHDVVSDEVIDADDTTAAELFADLEDVDTEDAAPDATEATSAGTGEEGDAEPFTAGPSPFFEEFAGVFVGEPSTTVSEDGGEVDSSAADLAAVEFASAEGAFEFGRFIGATADGADGAAAGSDTSGAGGTDGDTATDDTDGPDGDAEAATDDPAESDRSSGGLTLTGSTDDVELVGEPTRTRLPDDAFGR